MQEVRALRVCHHVDASPDPCPLRAAVTRARVDDRRHTDDVPHRNLVPTRAQRLRSGLFALLASPVAIALLGASVVSVESASAVGQPMSSTLGLLGMGVAAVLLGLVALNSEDSTVGMVVATAFAAVIGLLQMLGLVPGVTLLGASQVASIVTMGWSFHPFVVFVLLGSASAVMHWVRSNGLRRLSSACGDEVVERPASAGRGRVRSIAGAASMVCGALIVLLLVRAAPVDTTAVASRGIGGLAWVPGESAVLGLAAALCMMGIVVCARWSVIAVQVVAWVFLVVPACFLIPLWASLTGAVPTPGVSASTAVLLACPVLSAWGLALAALGLGPLWVRRRLAAAGEALVGADEARDADEARGAGDARTDRPRGA